MQQENDENPNKEFNNVQLPGDMVRLRVDERFGLELSDAIHLGQVCGFFRRGLQPSLNAFRLVQHVVRGEERQA
jgi:hypothetical protein